MSEADFLRYAALHAGLKGTSLLFSGGKGPQARRSFLCFDPIEILTVRSDSWQLENTLDGSFATGRHKNPWEPLKAHLRCSKKAFDGPEWIGYLAYEMGAFSDPTHHAPFHPLDIPLAQFFRAGTVITFEHATARSFVYTADSVSPLKGQSEPFVFPKQEALKAEEIFRIDSLTYSSQVAAIQEEIAAGNVYQVNLSHEVLWKTSEDPFLIFAALKELNPTPFSAYIKSDDFALISASPERLLKKEGNILEARPIKGTMPRGKTIEEDKSIAEKLQESVKERAELLMIVDLIRNDLSTVSIPGTVVVDSLMELETYPNVFHLISTIRAKAMPHLTSIDLLQKIFPGGSITGCPKLSAMEKIYRYENRPRGIYTGSIGYLTPNGDFDFNIAIRTLAHQGDRLSCGLGGGIVIDSSPLAEYEETLHKGQPIFKVLSQEKSS